MGKRPARGNVRRGAGVGKKEAMTLAIAQSPGVTGGSLVNAACRKYQEAVDKFNRVEVVDLFHFVISLAQVLGMKADDVFEAYVKKNEVNFRRQASGYRVKDEHDSRHV